jgi:ribonuclease Z
VSYRRLPEKEFTLVLESDEFRIFASPVRHLIPTIGLRMESMTTGKSIAYSCDTSPCEEVERLASGADVLIHEATGAGSGHTSAAQAGEVARRSGAKSLYLIHYPTRGVAEDDLVRSARETYPGPVDLARDFLELIF